MKKIVLSLSLGAALMASNLKSQVKAVNPSTFNGLYYTEEKMKIKYGGDFPFKTDEVTITFDAASGLLSGTLAKANPNMDKLKFHADGDKITWSKKSGIWFWANDNNNKSNYGPLFDYNNVTMATFIEEGVLVLFDASYMTAKGKFEVKKDVKLITIIAKDKSKLSMNKLEAAQKAEDFINAAGSAELTKNISNQAAAAKNVPNETLSKTDKALKKEVLEFFNSVPLGEGDQSDFICAYTMSNDWTIETNKLTGAILGREIIVEMIRKGRVSGKCRRFPYTVYQQYNGSGYGKMTFKRKWDLIECDCAQAEKVSK